jgi:hypothetical protein
MSVMKNRNLKNNESAMIHCIEESYSMGFSSSDSTNLFSPVISTTIENSYNLARNSISPKYSHLTNTDNLLKTFVITLVFFVAGIGSVVGQVEMNRVKARGSHATVPSEQKVDVSEISKSIWLLHVEMVNLSAKNESLKNDHIYNASFADFKRLCPNYPQDHFSKVNREELLPWVEKYPSQAKALKEILEYVNSELKK